MSFLAAETTDISIAELHDLDGDEFNTLYVTVSRRVDLTAGRHSGTRFLTTEDELAEFNSIDDALTFIDTIQSDGLPTAIQEQLNGDVDAAAIGDALHFIPQNVDPETYFESTGMENPFNLTITPVFEYAEPVETEPANPVA